MPGVWRLSAPVAPRAGAWIEACQVFDGIARDGSLPVRERGLKPAGRDSDEENQLSLPVRERGLKLRTSERNFPRRSSLPVRERGLKLFSITEKAL